MIRKYILGVFLLLLGFGFSFADDSRILPYTFGDLSVNNTIGSDLNFSNTSSSRGLWLDLSAVGGDELNHYYIFWNNGRLYNYGYYHYFDTYNQGYFYKSCKFSSTGNLVLPVCSNDSDFTELNANEFYGLTNYDFTKVYVSYYGDTVNPMICFYNSVNSSFYCFKGSILTGSLGIGSGFTSFNSFASYSPFSLSYNPDLGNGGIELGSDYSAVRYYENTYGWDESICYVGIDNLTTMYGQNGVSFDKGGGLSIFEAFSGLYGNTDLDKVYVWLNSWLVNYENWFGVSGSPGMSSNVGDPSYLVTYNSGTNKVDIYYDNLTFPFLNNPVAIYFMANNIESQSPYSTMGSSVVSYCNIKINSGTFDQIIDQSDKNNINGYTEQHNKTNGLNPDGSSIEHDGYFGSGVDIAFSGDTSIKNTLKHFFEEFDTALGTLDVNTNNRILPTWIVTAFIFVVLFKFLRKR